MKNAAKKLLSIFICLCMIGMLSSCSSMPPKDALRMEDEPLTVIPENTPEPIIEIEAEEGTEQEESAPANASLDLAAVRPMLNALAQAVVRHGEGFDGQCSSGLFTNYIYTLLRAGCIDETNCLVIAEEEGSVYRVEEQGLMQIYSKMINTGSYPGLAAGVNGVEISGSGAKFTLTPGEGEQSMLINGVTDLGEGSYSLFVTIWDDAPVEGDGDLGDYTVALRADSDALFGFAVTSIISSQPDVAQNTSQSVASTARARLDVFFGYDSVEMLDELSPIMGAVVDAVDENGGQFTVSPSSPVVWRAMQLMINTEGSKLPGVSIKEGKASILYDDMLLLYMDVFYNPGMGVPEIPEGMEDEISYRDGVYTFVIDQNDIIGAQLRSYEVTSGVSYFTMNDGGGFDLSGFNADAPCAIFKYTSKSGAEYQVSLCRSESSNYGIGIFDIK